MKHLPVIVTLGVFLALYAFIGFRYEGFFSVRVFIGFLADNATLGVVAVGMTLVILSGGIDLSVGSVAGCSAIAVALLVERSHIHPLIAFLLVILGGFLLGLAHGGLISRFDLPPFLVTLAGLFFCRGLGLLLSTEAIPINHSFLDQIKQIRIPLGAGVTFPFQALLLVTLLVVVALILKLTRFGRTVYAIGGSEQSALLMGLSVQRTRNLVYAFSGVCGAVSGILFAITTSSGTAVSGAGLELDAIAAVVIGGTLLSGGYGSVWGTLLGLLIFATIQTGLMFDGSLSSWWSKIATGGLLLVFIVLQRVIQPRQSRS
ncbi:MAG: galactofuranose ABC transporter, permease protein YjfF [Fimbriimonadaceae bacterium]